MERHRIDVWLKLTCIFKQRSEATQACDGGHVRLNGARAKPASPVKVGDTVEVIGERFRKLIVQGLPERTITKAEARTMYEDVTPKVEIDKKNRMVTFHIKDSADEIKLQAGKELTVDFLELPALTGMTEEEALAELEEGKDLDVRVMGIGDAMKITKVELKK